MKTRLRRLLLPLLASLALSGCFVFEEIQNGIDLMEEHSPAANAKRAQEAEEAESPSVTESELPQMKEKLAKWWRSVLEEEPPPPDPSDGIARCEVGGKVRFMRKSDFKLRGGRLVRD